MDTSSLVQPSTPTSPLDGEDQFQPLQHPPRQEQDAFQGFEASPPTSIDSNLMRTSMYGFLGVEDDEPTMQREREDGQSDDDVSGEILLGNRLRRAPHPVSDPGLPNPLPHQFNPSGTTLLPTVFLIVNAALGAGLLNFPKAFDDAGGVVVAMATQAVLLVPIVAALIILAFIADQNFADTIQEAMKGSGGVWGRRVTSAFVVVYCFGTTITFLIIIGDQFDRALASLVGHDFCHTWYLSRSFTMSASSVLFILPFCYSEKIDFLRIPSMLGVLAILYIVALITYEYFFGNFHHGPIKTSPTTWTDVFLVVPDICFGYQCHVSVIPIYSCMRNRTIKHFTAASVSAVLVCALCYSLAATFGYLTFGSLVNNDILLSYDASRPEVLIAIIAMAAKTFTTYPILLFCGREGIRSLVDDFCGGCGDRDAILRFAVASTWFSLSLVLSIFIPNIGEVIKILGSLAAVFIFVLPGFGLFQHVHRSDPSTYLNKSKAFLVASVIFMMLGAFFFGVVITQAVQYTLRPHGTEPPPICVKAVSMVEVMYGRA